jgi:nucleoid-associated protein YgaU
LDRFPADALATQGIVSLDGEVEPSEEVSPIVLEKINAQLKEVQENQEKHSRQLTEVLAQTQPKEENRSEDNIRDNQEVVDTRLQGIENRLNKRLLIGGMAAVLIIVLSIVALREVITLNNKIKDVQGTLQVIGDQRNKQLSEFTGQLNALTGQFQGKEEPNISPRVREALSNNDRINWLNISFQQENGGNIRLKGEVYTNYLKSLVEKIVGNIEGVTLVDSRELKIISSYKVQPRDTFWDIAEKVYGDGTKWEKIYTANQDKISNPRAIRENNLVLIPND